MWQYTEIRQYQLIQNGEKEYLFKINVGETFERETQLVEEFKAYLGDDAVFQIEYVKEIPLLDSGKRRKLVNNYKPST
jgi:phenylacetate-CoA ligase